MIFLSKIYIFLYFFYCYFGYNIIYRITMNKQIDHALLNKQAYAFIGKRIFMLSHLVLLYSAFYLEYPNTNRYNNIFMLHFIVNSGYYVIWELTEKSTLFMHIFWSVPVLCYNNENIKNIHFNLYNYEINNENLILLIFLLIYSKLFRFIYTPRLEFIDKPK